LYQYGRGGNSYPIDLELARCDVSPTGAHWSRIVRRGDPTVGHDHEYEICKFCQREKLGYCWECEHKAAPRTPEQLEQSALLEEKALAKAKAKLEAAAARAAVRAGKLLAKAEKAVTTKADKGHVKIKRSRVNKRLAV